MTPSHATPAPPATFTAWVRLGRRAPWQVLPQTFANKGAATTAALAHFRARGLTYGDTLNLPAGDRPGR